MTSMRNMNADNNKIAASSPVLIDKIEWSDRMWLDTSHINTSSKTQSRGTLASILDQSLCDPKIYFESINKDHSRSKLSVGGRKFSSTNGKRLLNSHLEMSLQNKNFKSEFGEKVDNIICPEGLNELKSLSKQKGQEPWRVLLDFLAETLQRTDEHLVKYANNDRTDRALALKVFEVYFEFITPHFLTHQVVEELITVIKAVWGLPDTHKVVQEEIGKRKDTAIAMWSLNPSYISDNYVKAKSRKQYFNIKLYRKADRYRFEISANYPKLKYIKSAHITNTNDFNLLIKGVCWELVNNVGQIQSIFVERLNKLVNPENHSDLIKLNHNKLLKAIGLVGSKLSHDKRAEELLLKLAKDERIELAEWRALKLQNSLNTLRRAGILKTASKGLNSKKSKSKLVYIEWTTVEGIVQGKSCNTFSLTNLCSITNKRTKSYIRGRPRTNSFKALAIAASGSARAIRIEEIISLVRPKPISLRSE